MVTPTADERTPVLVERHRGTSIHPRARGVNGRTMELYREIGLEEAVRDAGAALAPAFGIYAGESLQSVLGTANPAEQRAALAGLGSFARFAALSPTTGSRGTQDLIEPILRAAAEARGGDLRFHTELTAFTRDDDGVTASLLDRASGTARTVRADYLIAADGANARIRAALGVPTSGRGSLGHFLNVLFRADLADLVRGREFSLCRIDRPEVTGLFAAIDNATRWVFHIAYDPARGESPADYPEARCVELIRTALGLPAAAIEIVSILPWEAAVRVARDFQVGRVFLAGDAAHQMPPWGGQGANTGVADAHNLAWKLAAVLQGRAAPTLLATYDAERRPVGTVAAEESGQVADERGLFTIGNVGQGFADRFIRLIGYGNDYASAAITPEHPPAGPDPELLGIDGRPGTRQPHARVERDGQRLSTLDLGDGAFLLLAGPAGAPWRDAAQEVAARLGQTIAAYTVGPDGDLRDEDGAWSQASGTGAAGALLVRPDGFVAWRARGCAADPAAELTRALRRALGKGEAAVA
jgi:putative polyketide hydroxylase